MPCADAAVLKKGSKQKSENVNKTEQQNHDDTDECSPFCHCACCAGFSINHTVAVLSKVPAYSENHKTSFLPLEVIEIVSPIWQPPRLV